MECFTKLSSIFKYILLYTSRNILTQLSLWQRYMFYHLGANLSNFCLALTLGPAQSYPLICSIGEKYKTYWKVLRGHQHNRQPIKLTTLAFSCLSMSSTFYPSFKLAPFSQQSCVRSTTSCLGRRGQHSFADVGGKGRGRYVGRPLIEGGLQSPT